MSVDTLIPGLKPSFTKKGFGAHLLSGGLLPPGMGRGTSDALGITKPKVPKVPGAPTIDDATIDRQESDRIRKRKGALANVFAGANSPAPTVGTRVLMGG
jgi:hypothetical protein